MSDWDKLEEGGASAEKTPRPGLSMRWKRTVPAPEGAEETEFPRNVETLGEYSGRFTREGIGELAVRKVSTGFPSLDRRLNGGLSNGLYVLGAVPGLGKSSLALQIAANVSSQGSPVLYFSLEMSRAWILAKSMCRVDFMRSPELQAANSLRPDRLLDAQNVFSEAEWARLEQVREAVRRENENLYLYVQGPDVNHIGHIQEKIRAFRRNPANQERYGDRPLMVVIDYLQILAPKDGGSRASDKQIVDENVRMLCKIREHEQVITLLISALNRSSYNRPVSLESFKESGSIEYSADVIMGMQYQGMGRPGFSLEEARAANPRELELSLLKMRYGQAGVTVPLYFYGASSCFRQPDGADAGEQERLQALRKAFAGYRRQDKAHWTR